MSARPAWFFAACVAVFGTACAAMPHADAPPPPAPPELREPALAMPADLDLVVRIDLRRLRGVLGGGLGSILEEMIARAPGEDRDAATGRLVLELLSRSDTVWLGARPGLSPALTDNVLVLRGALAGVVPERIGGEPPWSPPERFGGGVLRYLRSAQPRGRAVPAVLYLREPDLAVIGSTAELDALALGIEERRGAEPLRAKEAGIVALSARVPVLSQRLRQKAPTAARLFEGATRLSATVDRKAANLEFELELEYATAARAAEVADPIRDVVAALARSGFGFLSTAEVSAAGAVIAIRLALPQADSERLLACWISDDCGTTPSQPSRPGDVLPSAPP